MVFTTRFMFFFLLKKKSLLFFLLTTGGRDLLLYSPTSWGLEVNDITNSNGPMDFLPPRRVSGKCSANLILKITMKENYISRNNVLEFFRDNLILLTFTSFSNF